MPEPEGGPPDLAEPEGVDLARLVREHPPGEDRRLHVGPGVVDRVRNLWPSKPESQCASSLGWPLGAMFGIPVVPDPDLADGVWQYRRPSGEIVEEGIIRG